MLGEFRSASTIATLRPLIANAAAIFDREHALANAAASARERDSRADAGKIGANQLAHAGWIGGSGVIDIGEYSH